MDIYLTGIKPTGSPHIGNYLGAIEPALARAKQPGQFFYFIADYHALNFMFDPKLLQQYTREIAATWLAMGLDPSKVVFYRQSDVPEILELSWILSCAANKGLMNRAHAYKAKRSVNEEEGRDPDWGINMGLFCYPVLMAADILAFKANKVPVSQDQFQHLEIARDIAATFNNRYKADILAEPKPLLEQPIVIAGTDGRKMSKSYDNTIPLFCTEKKLKKIVNTIATDSTPPEAPKDTSHQLYQLFKAFASEEEITAMKGQFESGISWGAVKAVLFNKLAEVLAEPRQKYQELMAHPSTIDGYLAEGAQKARQVARAQLDAVKHAAGLAPQ